jgi:hypothetical protein
VLQKSTTIENGGEIVWQLAACLFASWVITFLCIFKGIKSSGKVGTTGLPFDLGKILKKEKLNIFLQIKLRSFISQQYFRL